MGAELVVFISASSNSCHVLRRYHQPHQRSASGRRDDFDSVSERIREPLDDREAQSDAFPGVFLRRLSLIKGVEDLVDAIERDTVPSVPDLDVDIPAAVSSPRQALGSR